MTASSTPYCNADGRHHAEGHAADGRHHDDDSKAADDRQAAHLPRSTGTALCGCLPRARPRSTMPPFCCVFISRPIRPPSCPSAWPCRNWYLIPQMAAVWSASSADVLAFPARTFIQFSVNHSLLQVSSAVIQGLSLLQLQACHGPRCLSRLRMDARFQIADASRPSCLHTTLPAYIATLAY